MIVESDRSCLALPVHRESEVSNWDAVYGLITRSPQIGLPAAVCRSWDPGDNTCPCVSAPVAWKAPYSKGEPDGSRHDGVQQPLHVAIGVVLGTKHLEIDGCHMH